MNASPIDLRLMLFDGLLRRIDEAGVPIQMRTLYAYLHRLLVEARVERCPPKLDEARRLVEFEHETWSMLNQRLADGDEPNDGNFSRIA